MSLAAVGNATIPICMNKKQNDMPYYNRDMMHCAQDQCKKKDQCYRYWLGQNEKYSASPYASYYQPDKPVTDGCEFYINKDYFD